MKINYDKYEKIYNDVNKLCEKGENITQACKKINVLKKTYYKSCKILNKDTYYNLCENKYGGAMKGGNMTEKEITNNDEHNNMDVDIMTFEPNYNLIKRSRKNRENYKQE